MNKKREKLPYFCVSVLIVNFLLHVPILLFMNKKRIIAIFFVSGGWYNRLVDIESSLRSLGSVSGSQLFQVAAHESRDCSGRRHHANICFF
jgi:hypothetical protein